MRVAFRFDASAQIGTGHARRCAALAETLRNIAVETIVVTRETGVDCAAWFPNSTLLALPAAPAASQQTVRADHLNWLGVEQSLDASQTVAALSELEIDWLIVDHYAISKAWHDTVRNVLGCRLLVIDDLADRMLSADLIVDHNWHQDHSRKYKSVQTRPARILGGPRYALLAPAFVAAPRYDYHDEVRSIGIFMGGADAINATSAALDGVRASGFTGPVELVATRANPHLESLRKKVAVDHLASLSLDLPDLAGFFGRHDLHLGAGGGATWERCMIGAPMIAIICAENQRQVLEPLSEHGIARILDWVGMPVGTGLVPVLRELMQPGDIRLPMSLAAKKLVDGNGCSRVASEMLAMI